MITPQEIEAYAADLIFANVLDRVLPEHDEPIGREAVVALDPADANAVLSRVAEITDSDQSVAAWLGMRRATRAVADSLKAAGCSDGEPIIPWLHERGLVEQVDDGGWRFKTPAPRSAP